MLREGWERFERDVIGREAGDIQRECMREAFYAGAFWCFSFVFGNKSTPVDIDVLRQEIEQFARDVVERQKRRMT